MKLIISFCAPAVMESIATTAPTPKIMPSIVSKLRNLCAKRLERPIFSSGRMPENMPMWLLASRHAAHAAARRLLIGLALLVGGRIGQRHHLSGLDTAGQHHQRFALLHQLHFARLELAVLLDEHNVLSVLVEYRLRRNVDHIGKFFDMDFHVG